MSNVDKLLSLYNELDSLLRVHYGVDDRSVSVIYRYINDLERSGSSRLEKVGRTLNMVRVIRNALIHELDMNADHLMEVKDETIEFLSVLVDFAKNPSTALSKATPVSSLLCIKEGEKFSLPPLLKKMNEKGHSQVPCLDKKGKLIGVFSPNVLFSYLLDNHKDVNDITFADLLPYLPLKKHFSEHYLFVGRDDPMEKVGDLFYEGYRSGKKIVMAFITEHGLEDEALLGILVIKDLIY